jgi:hypothetical protein
MKQFGIGQPVRRVEDRRFITGRGAYLDDLCQPRQAWAYLLRSPHAHAGIRGIDTTAALSAPSVLAVYTGENLARDGIGTIPCLSALTNRDGFPAIFPPHPARRASAQAMLTRAMKVDGPLRDLIDKGLVLADEANRQPECFKGIERVSATLPVVIPDGPIADLRTFPDEHLTKEAREAKKELVTSLSTVRLPVRYADKTAREVSTILFEVERQKLRAESKLKDQHIEQVREMYRSLVNAFEGRREAAE